VPAAAQAPNGSATRYPMNPKSIFIAGIRSRAMQSPPLRCANAVIAPGFGLSGLHTLALQLSSG